MSKTFYEPITALIIVGATIVLAVAGFSSWYYMGQKQDGPVEEFCEEKVQDLTGLEIDLSPSSPEVDVEATK